MDNQPYALVVDNSPVIRRIVSSVLEKKGWVVQTAENGLEALDFIASRRPDIIFTDLIMPKIDGEKLAYIIRSTPELKHIFLVILSGVAMEDDDHTAKLGADVCIAKGPAATMRDHILAALVKFKSGIRNEGNIEGMENLYPREVTKELLVSKRHRDVILANMTEGVVELNHEGRIVMANSAAIQLFGIDEAKLLSHRVYTMFPQEEQQIVKKWIASLVPSGDLAPLVFDYDQPVELQGQQVIINFVPVAEEDTVFIIVILKDITPHKLLEKKQRKLEKELHRIQKIDAMSVMASGIAHDFNNLLTVINGNVEMSRFLNKEKQVDALLEEAGKALQLTVQLIRKFTTFSDNYLPQTKKVNLSELVTETLEHELADTNIALEIEDKSRDASVKLDASLIHQVLTNLTSNAVDAMNGQGTIQVAMELVDGEIEAGQTGQPLPSCELVRIVFKDNGPGIAPEILDHVFDPYFSTKQKGSQKGMGLGLTIVHSTIKKHRGMVWVESQPGLGCSVHMYLPITETPATSEAIFEEHVARQPRVLVMDDDEMMRVINQKMFQHYNCNVSLASSGEEAVALYLKGEKEEAGFDLTLLDLRVNEGMGGVEASAHILECNPEAKIILISGDAGNEVILNYKEYGFVAALTKPFSIDTVESVVQHFLHKENI